MRKKIFLKILALVICFSILSLHVPGVIAAEKNVKKFHFRLLIKRPAIMLSSLFPFLRSVSDTGNSTPSNQAFKCDTDSGGKVKVTGGLLMGKVAKGD